MLRLRNGKWWYVTPATDGSGALEWVQAPEVCFGTSCEVSVMGEDGDQCRTCVFHPPCLEHMATVTIPVLEAEGKDVVTMAKELSINASAVEYAQSKRAECDRPFMTGSAQPATGPVEREQANRNKTASRALQRDVKPPRKTPPGQPVNRKREWSPKRDKSRWLREREKNPAIAALTPGIILRREYRGNWYEVKVVQGGYIYDKHLYPTLYAVVKVIVGTKEVPRQRNKDGHRPAGSRNLCNWSACRFWKLGKYAPAPKRKKYLG